MELIGRTLGPYRIQGHLGRGGAADVYRALHEGLAKEVALKVLFEESAEDAEQIARFQRESRVLARLSHPGIVEVYDCGSEGSLHYFAMVLLEYHTLGGLLAAHGGAGGWLPVPQAVTIISSILEVLQTVHAENIVHRDLKPSNIFVTAEDQAILSDFGLVKVIDEGTLTASPDMVLGTIHYMAPEQILSEPADVRTDLYQVGLVLYRMLYGRLPFGEHMAEVVQKKTLAAGLKPPVPAPREVPPGLLAVLEKACRRDRRERFATAAEFLTAVEQLSLASRPVSARTPVVAPARAPQRQTRAGGAVRALAAPSARRSRRVRTALRAVLALSAALIASVVVGLVLARALPGPRAPRAPSAAPAAPPVASASAAADPRLLAESREIAKDVQAALGSECTKVLIASVLATDLSRLRECHDREADRLASLEARLTSAAAALARTVEASGDLPARSALASLTLHHFLLGCRRHAVAGLRDALARRSGALTRADLQELPPLMAADAPALAELVRHTDQTRDLAREMAAHADRVEGEAGQLVEDVRALARLSALEVWAPESAGAARDHLRQLAEAASRAPAPVGPALAQCMSSVGVMAQHQGKSDVSRAVVRAAIEDLAGLRAVLPAAHAGLAPLLADAWRDWERAAP